MWENTTISTIFGERKGWKVQDWKISIKHHLPMSLSLCFTMYLRHFLPHDLYFLTSTIQKIITNSTSPPNMCTMTPVAEVNLEVDSWTTTPKTTTAGSSLGFEINVCEDTLSTQSTYKKTAVVRIIKLPLLQIHSY
jgi:hypothetical protein